MQTFETLIRHNLRSSALLVFAIVACLTLFGGLSAVVLFEERGAPLEAFFSGALLLLTLGTGFGLMTFYWGGQMITFATAAKRLERFEDVLLFNVVEEISLAAGIKPPAIYMIFDDAPNALACGRSPAHSLIAVTAGLRRKLNREELQAVVAHEIAHITNYDTRLSTLIATFAGLLVIFSDFFLRAWLDSAKNALGGGRRARITIRPRYMLSLPFIALALCVAWAAPIVTKLLQLAVSREREYLADATAVKYCRNNQGLICALRKIALDQDHCGLTNRATEHLFIVNPNPARRLQAANKDSVWCTHPPLIKRIARLEKLGV